MAKSKKSQMLQLCTRNAKPIYICFKAFFTVKAYLFSFKSLSFHHFKSICKIIKMDIEKKKKIMELLIGGESVRKVANKFGVSHMTVQRLKKNCSEHIKINKGGRPRVLSERDTRHVANLVTSNPDTTPIKAANMLNLNASEWTVRRSLGRLGLKAKEMKKKPFLAKRHISLRKDFATMHENWTLADWDAVSYK